MRRALKVALPFAVLLAGVAAFAFLVMTKPELVPEPTPEETFPVAVSNVAIGDIQPDIIVFGEVVAGREVELRALVAGETTRIGDSFREGGIVRAGDLLVVIDEFEYRAALDEADAQIAETDARREEIAAGIRAEEAALERDREILSLEQRNLERAQELSRSQVASERAVDDARIAVSRQRQTVKLREIGIEADEARMEQQAAALQRLAVARRRAARDLERARLRAPFDGFLSGIGTDIGKRLSVNDRVTSLIDADALEVRANLSNDQFGRLMAAGGVMERPAEVVWAPGRSRLAFTAEVARVGARIQSESGGVDIFLTLKGEFLDKPLRPGAFVEVMLPDRPYRDVARIPESALYGGERVYVVTEGRLEERTIKVVARVGADILVTGDLRTGERVVRTRFPGIGPGVAVEVIE